MFLINRRFRLTGRLWRNQAKNRRPRRSLLNANHLHRLMSPGKILPREIRRLRLRR
jgi:hypothetical protein